MLLISDQCELKINCYDILSYLYDLFEGDLNKKN